jgi:hypothetical protein
VITGFRITPVARIEEASQLYPDLQGNPLFFFDQSRNEFFVKQRKVQTGEVQILRYKLSSEPLTPIEAQTSTNSYDEQIKSLQKAIEELSAQVSVKVKKVEKEDDK